MNGTNGEKDVLSRAVATTLDDAARDLHVVAPSWDVVEAGLRRVRRRRHDRQVMGAVAGVLVAAGLVGGIQSGAVPYPRWAPAVVVASSGQASALVAGGTRGSLAGDAAWLADLRQVVARWDRVDTPTEHWRATSADDVVVLFAGDVGTFRAALVETPVRSGLLETRTQLWFVGAAGARAGDLTQGPGGGPVQDVVVQTLDASVLANARTSDGRAVTGRALVVLVPDTRTVDVATAPSVDSAGVLHWTTTPLQAQGPGGWTTTLPAEGTAYLRMGGATPTWQELPVASGTWDDEPLRTMPVVRTLPDVRHPVNPYAVEDPPQTLREAFINAGSIDGGPKVRLWSGAIAGWNVDVVVRATAAPASGLGGATTPPPSPGTVDAARADLEATPGGGYLVAVSGEHALGPIQPDGGVPIANLTALVARPAGALADLAVAVRLPDAVLRKEGDPGWDRRNASPAVLLLGPTTATTATVTAGDGSTSEVRLRDGVGSGPALDATRAVFRDADGRTLADVPVAAYDAKLPPPR